MSEPYSLGPYSISEPIVSGDSLSCYVRRQRAFVRRGVTAEFVAFRVFLGGVNVENLSTGTCYETNVNYFEFPPKQYDISLGTFFLQAGRAIQPAPFLYNKFFDTFFDIKARSNNNFYGEFLVDILRSFEYCHLGHYSNGFLHLYRAIEHMGLAIPLIYLSGNDNYVNCFESLKGLMKGDGGELSVGYKFLKSIMDENLLKAQCDIDFRGQPASHGKILEDVFNKSKDKKAKNIFFDRERENLSLSFADCWNCIVIVRNQYFHHMFGQDRSIRSAKLYDPDLFFKPFLDVFYNFVANFYLSAFMQRYEAS